MEGKTDNQKEQAELDLLIGRGFYFEATRRSFFKKEKKAQYEVKQPTLATLDLITGELLKIDIDETRFSGGIEALAEAKNIASKHSMRMARIVAMATLGEDCFSAICGKYIVNEMRIARRTQDIAHSVTPQMLKNLCNGILEMANLGDFMTSTRLMSAARTTAPKSENVG